MISLRLEHQKRIEENAWLHECELSVMTCQYHTENQQKYKYIHTYCENSRVVAGNSTNALSFVHISHLGWESDQNEGIITHSKPQVTELRPNLITGLAFQEVES